MNNVPLNIARTFLVASAVSIFSSAAMTQSLQAGGGVGYFSPSGDFGGSTVDHYAGTKYGFSGGLNLHAKARIDILVLNVVAEVGYTSVSNSGDAEPGQGKVEISQKILSFKIGPEYRLSLPALPLTPYFGVHVALNRFSGETQFNGVSKVSSGTFTVKSATRIGVGAGGGAVFKINPMMSLDIGVSYNLMNMAGRLWEDQDPTKDQRIDSYTSLNDEKDPVALNANEHFVGSARSISSFQVTATLLFGI